LGIFGEKWKDGHILCVFVCSVECRVELEAFVRQDDPLIENLASAW
jgi:hypothetical protein